ncbi:MAG TPA: RsmB/NOP family class I SAM-dependent RNA methyltransferase [Firmicutes bacterium]|nr:RsmB/NOP family class I SAM-dependent RNA methyltransferase [Bacillota bacterium]
MGQPYSIGQAAQRLPAEFVKRLRQLFPGNLSDMILKGLGSGRYTTLRANTLKCDIRSLMNELRRSGIKFERVPWYNDALVIKNARERDIEGLELYKNGYLYLQNLSSMIPPLILDLSPGQKVLDMAAAPGSKTTQAAMIMQNQGYILANDINPVRIEKLKYNLDLQGVRIAQVSMMDGALLGRSNPEEFDRVLLDAPCSGEGTFLVGDPGTYRSWSLKLVKRSAALQKRLLRSAIHALKPGGILVYSTCTFSPEENEMNIAWALEKFQGQIEVVDIPLQLPRSLKGIRTFPSSAVIDNASQTLTGESGGHRDSREIVLPPDVERCIRIPPSETMEGFFICKLRKIASVISWSSLPALVKDWS